MLRRAIQKLPTRSTINNLFQFLQSTSIDERQQKLANFIDSYASQNETLRSKFINDMMYCWTVEQPNREALKIYGNNNSECHKLTFKDVYTESCRMANVLTDARRFDLITGNTVSCRNKYLYSMRPYLFLFNLLNRYWLSYRLMLKNAVYYD